MSLVKRRIQLVQSDDQPPNDLLTEMVNAHCK